MTNKMNNKMIIDYARELFEEKWNGENIYVYEPEDNDLHSVSGSMERDFGVTLPKEMKKIKVAPYDHCHMAALLTLENVVADQIREEHGIQLLFADMPTKPHLKSYQYIVGAIVLDEEKMKSWFQSRKDVLRMRRDEERKEKALIKEKKDD